MATPSTEPLSALLSKRRRPLLAVDRDTPVRDAARLMEDARLDAVLVPLEEGGWGVLTERDVVRAVVARGLDPDETQTGWIVWDGVPESDAEQRVGDAIARLVELGREHLLVTDEGRHLALLSLAELSGHALGQAPVDRGDLLTRS